MSYHASTKALVKGPSTLLGVRLGKAAVKHGVSVQDISHALGASRTTIYTWFAGGNVTNAYKRNVLELLKKIQAT